MAWLFDKAIDSDTAFVTIKSASDYLRETGKSRNGDRVKELAARLSRLTGLVIGIEALEWSYSDRHASDDRIIKLAA